jgi:hypothetical protein
MGFELDLEWFEKNIPPRFPPQNPIIDLRDCSWIYPEGAIAVFLIVRYYNQIGLRPTIIRPTNQDVDTYFERTGVIINSYQYVDYVPKPENIISHSWYERKTMQEITKVEDSSHVARIVNKFGNALKNQINNDSVVTKMKSVMLETFQNMPEHANPNNPSDFEGYANIQIYKDANRIVVAAGDLGVGIKNSLQTSELYKRVQMDDLDAIKRVVYQRASRYAGTPKDSQHGGGVHRVFDIMKRLKGGIAIRSGTAAIILRPFNKYELVKNLRYFPGTQISITLVK